MANSQGAMRNPVTVPGQAGFPIIPAATPLTRLNYFDGKYLRASDLQLEQNYFRTLHALSNQSGGTGVVHGFHLMLTQGDTLTIGSGMGIDPSGLVLLLPVEVSVPIGTLIDASRDMDPVGATGGAAQTTSGPSHGAALYLLTLNHAEDLCGQEATFGALATQAGTMSERPFQVEGVVVRALPLALAMPPLPAVALDRRHLRSRVASAYYADEARQHASIISGAGLDSDAWCLGARPAGGEGIPIGVLAMDGSAAVFADAWTARRERIEGPAQRYWQWRMAMRPWDVFVAQILQFQCQLHEVLTKVAHPGGKDDPGVQRQEAVQEAARLVSGLQAYYRRLMATPAPESPAAAEAPQKRPSVTGELAAADMVQKNLAVALHGVLSGPRDRVLVNGGIVELPPAGYLPVVPTSAVPISRQVRQLLGEGLDLRFCVARPDYVPHALEECQHMERISLVHGLDHPDDRPAVDILVPDGCIDETEERAPGVTFEATLVIEEPPPSTSGRSEQAQVQTGAGLRLHGAARAECLESGGWEFSAALGTKVLDGGELAKAMETAASGVRDFQDAVRALASTSHEHGKAPHVVAQFAAAVRAITHPFGLGAHAPETAAGQTPAGQSQGATAESPPVSSLLCLWASVRCERDLLTMAPGEATGVHVLADLVVPGKDSIPVMFEICGKFVVTQVTSKAGTRTVMGVLSGPWGYKVDDKPHRGGLILLPATITMEEASGHLTLALDVGATTILTMKSTWKSAEAKHTVELLLHGPSGSPPADTTLAGMELGFEELPGGEVEGTLETLVRSIIQIVGAKFSDPDLLERAQRSFLGGGVREEGRIAGKFDWVLFRRRRDQRCVEPRRRCPPLFGEGLHQRPVAEGPPSEVSVPQSRAPEAPPPEVSLDEELASEGPLTEVIGATEEATPSQGVSPMGEQGGRAQASAPEPPPVETPPAEVLKGGQRSPEATAAFPWALTSVEVYRTPSHAVSGVKTSRDLKRFVDRDQDGRLGEVPIEEGTPHIVDVGPVLRAWQHRGGGAPGMAVVFARSGDAAAGSRELRQQRALNIMELLGGSRRAEVTIVDVPDPLPSPAPVLIVLVALPVPGQFLRR